MEQIQSVLFPLHVLFSDFLFWYGGVWAPLDLIPDKVKQPNMAFSANFPISV